MPLQRRVPKLKGFSNAGFRTTYQVVNIARLADLYPDGGDVTPENLVANGAVRSGELIKVLGTGDVSVAVRVTAHAFSASAAPQDPERRRDGYRALLAPASEPEGRGAAWTEKRESATREGGALRRPGRRASQLTANQNHLPGKIRGLPDQPNRGLRMLTAFVRAFQTPDLRKKMLITLGLIALFRFGASLPTPGINERNVAYCSNRATSPGSPRPACSASSTCSAARRC